MLEHLMKKMNIPIDIWQGSISKFLTLRQMWILRFVSKEWQRVFNKAFFRIFKERFEKIHLNTSGLSITHMNDYMFRYATWCFTGSSVLSTILDEKWSNQDLDVFVEGQIYFNLDPNKLTIIYLVDDPEYCEDLHEIYKCVTVLGDRDVDVCVRPDLVDDVEELVSNFDLTCCMNVYDGKTLWIYNPTLLFQKIMVKVRTNDYNTLRRVRKYHQRGFREYKSLGYIYRALSIPLEL
jgi:hypothetical protein